MKKPRPIHIILIQLFLINLFLVSITFGPFGYYLFKKIQEEKEQEAAKQLERKTDRYRNVRPKVDIPDQPAPTPAAVNNLVLIRSEDRPEELFQGVYFQQRDGRSFFATRYNYREGGKKFDGKPNPIKREQASYTVEFHSGPSAQQAFPARYLAENDKVHFFEVSQPLPDPVEMNWTRADYRKSRVSNVYGFQWFEGPSETDTAKYIETAYAAQDTKKTELLNVRKQLLSGALVCDARGVPCGLLSGQSQGYPSRKIPELSGPASELRGLAKLRYINRIKYLKKRRTGLEPYVPTLAMIPETIPDTTREVLSFPTLVEQGTDARVSAVIEEMNLQVDRYTLKARLTYQDPLGLIDEVELYVGTLGKLKPKLDVQRQTQFDQLVTTDMQKVKLQPNSSYRGWLHSLHGVFAGPVKDQNPRHFITQTCIRYRDGTFQFSKPNYDKSVPVSRQRMEEPPFQPYVPVVDKRENQLSYNNEEKRLGEKIIGFAPPSLNSIYAKIKDALLDEAAWSTDGKNFFLLSQYGRLMKIRVADLTQVRSIDLLRQSVDLDLSQAGVIVLAEQDLLVFDPETLEIKREIPVPGALLAGAGVDSNHAYVTTEDQLLHVDLETGAVQPVSIKRAAGLPDPFFSGQIYEIVMTEDGETLVLSDGSRIHRFLVQPDQSLEYAESTIPLAEQGRLRFQQGDRRVALIENRTRSRRRSIQQAGFPIGNYLVYQVDDLSKPVTGVEGTPTFLPHSGGILDQKSPSLTNILRENGVLADIIKTGLGPGYANPMQNQIIFPTDNSGSSYYVMLAKLSNPFDKADSLRKETDQQLKPTVKNQTIPAETKQHDDWYVTRLKLEIQEKPVPDGSENHYRKRLSRHQSVIWSDTGDVCFILTGDSVIHRIRVPEMREESQIKLAGAVGLYRSKAGLVVDSNLRQEVVLLDETTLEVKQRIRLVERELTTAAPAASQLWYKRRRNKSDFYESFEVHILDLVTGQDRIAFTDSDLRKWQSDSGPGKQTRIEKVSGLQLSPDARYLFLVGDEFVYRFAIQDQSVALEDLIVDMNDYKPAPYFTFSPDARYIAVGYSMVQWRDSYPEDTTGRIDRETSGSYIFPVDDFDHLKAHVATEKYNWVRGFNTKTGELYTLDYTDAPRSETSSARPKQLVLQVYQPDGAPAESVSFPVEEYTHSLSPHPLGQGLLIAGEELIWLSESAPEK